MDCEMKYKTGDILPSNGVSFRIFEGNQYIGQLYALICYEMITSDILHKLVDLENMYTKIIQSYPTLKKYKIGVNIEPHFQPISEYNSLF